MRHEVPEGLSFSGELKLYLMKRASLCDADLEQHRVAHDFYTEELTYAPFYDIVDVHCLLLMTFLKFFLELAEILPYLVILILRLFYMSEGKTIVGSILWLFISFLNGL